MNLNRNNATRITLRLMTGGTALCLSATLLIGCAAQLQAVRVVDPANIPREGAAYNLTFTQYDLVLTRSLLGCWAKLANGENDEKTPKLSILLEASVTRKETRDPKRDYVIDFAQLRSFFKTSDVTVEYHANGALKSVNAAVTDQSGAFFTSVVTSFGKVATVASGGLVPSSETAKPVPTCNRATLEALFNVKKHDAEVRSATDESEALRLDIERLTKIAQVMGRAAWSNQERADLKDRISKFYVIQNKLTNANRSLAAAKKMLVIDSARTWPEDGETREMVSKLFPQLSKDDLNKWITAGTYDSEAISDNIDVWGNLVGTTPIGKTKPCTASSCAEDAPVGLKYRMAVPGALLLCSSAQCAAVSDADIKVVQETAISQLGPIMTLPLKNYPFMTQTIAAAFNEAGQPTKLGFTQTPSPTSASDALGSLVGEVSKYRAATKPKAEIDGLKDETALLQAKVDLAAAQANQRAAAYSSQADSVALLNADASVLRARLAKLEGEAALAKALAVAEKP